MRICRLNAKFNSDRYVQIDYFYISDRIFPDSAQIWKIPAVYKMQFLINI